MPLQVVFFSSLPLLAFPCGVLFVAFFFSFNTFVGSCAYVHVARCRPFPAFPSLLSSELLPKLAHHPDRATAQYVLVGTAHGLSAGFDASRIALRSSLRNMPPSTSILASWTRIWLPKSPRAALRARSLHLLFSPSLAASAAGSQEWSTRNWRLLWALLCAFRSPSHLIRLTGNSVAIYSSGWSFYNRGMSSIFFSRIPPICSFRDDVPPRIPMEPTVLCRPPLFRQWSAFVSWSQRTFGGSLTSLTSRVPVRQSCRRSNHQLWFRAGSFVRASDAPPWSRRLPIPVPISARHVHSRPRAATGPLSRSHGQGFHGFPPTSDPSPTRVPPALVSALFIVHRSRSV